jgi:hypothetical protein
MSASALATRAFTPLAFRPSAERVVLIALGVLGAALWLLLLPAEIALSLT